MILMINLSSAADRRAAMQARLEAFGLRYERVAVDLRHGSRDEARERASKAFPRFRVGGRSLSSAEIGCWLSHLTAWQVAIERGARACVVIEDDLILEPHFADTCDRLLADMPRDLVYLGTSSRNISVRRAVSFGGFRLHEPIGGILNTWAYAIDTGFAARILDSGVEVAQPIDHVLGRANRRYGASLAVLSPAAVREDPELGRKSQIAPFTARPDRAAVVEGLRRRFLSSRLGDAYYAAMTRFF